MKISDLVAKSKKLEEGLESKVMDVISDAYPNSDFWWHNGRLLTSDEHNARVVCQHLNKMEFSCKVHTLTSAEKQRPGLKSAKAEIQFSQVK